MATLRTAKFRVASLLALAISAIAVAGCGSASSSSSSTAAAAQPASSSTSAASSSAPAASGITIATAKGPHGTYLVGASGRALYLWVADSGGKSACSGACAHAWPPLEGSATAGTGVTASDLGTLTRSDGSKQVTYKGHPLYYFIADKSAGSTIGQGNNGFGAKWWLVAPSGDAITTGASSSSGSSGGAYG
jgi:predicted lipoprotein with Yx(FWY)xxD motif